MKKKQQLSTLRKIADRLLQEWGRKAYSRCLVCGKEMSALHHFIAKSLSANLRYDKDNCVPLCYGCHMAIHRKSDPAITDFIIKTNGDDWWENLKRKRRIPHKESREYYEKVIENLK